MDMERNLFDIVQDFVPDDELAEDKSEAIAIERVKLRVFQKKGVKRMRHRGLKRLAVAAAAVIALAGGVVSVDAATGGKLAERIGKITVTIIGPDGSEVANPATIKKEKNATYRLKIETKDVDDNSHTAGPDENLGEKDGSREGDSGSKEEVEYSNAE